MNTTTKHLLVPVDFSPISQTAFKYALYIAKKTAAKITLLHSYVVDFGLPMPSVGTYEILKIRRENSELGLKKMLESADNSGVLVETRSEVGIPWDTICEIAKKENFDAIVIGTKGEHNAAENFFGSVTTHVIKNAHCPVWVVPEGTVAKPIQHIAYATALSADNSDTVSDVIELARQLDSAVHCVHINTRHTDDMLEVANFEELIQVKDNSVVVDFTQIENDQVEEALEQFVKERNIDVLALLRPHRSLFERIFHRSQTRKIALSSEVPLYIFRE